MRAGQLDRQVIVQRRTTSQSSSGDTTETWQDVGSMRWAYRFPLSGTERFNVPSIEALEQVEFRIRWSEDIVDLQPKDRLIEPAEDAPAPPSRSIYDILAVHELGRKEGFRVFAYRRADSPP